MIWKDGKLSCLDLLSLAYTIAAAPWQEYFFCAEPIRMWGRCKRKKVQWRSSEKITSHPDQNTMWKRPVHKKYIPETVPACPTTEKVVVEGYRRIKRDRYNIIITHDRDTPLFKSTLLWLHFKTNGKGLTEGMEGLKFSFCSQYFGSTLRFVNFPKC